MDEGYIEALSEELYKKLFESGHYGKAVLKKADAAVSEEQRSETAPQNAALQDIATAGEEMQPVDAVQSAEIPETAAYSTEPQTMARKMRQTLTMRCHRTRRRKMRPQHTTRHHWTRRRKMRP